eukprot:1480546-Pyramimonas_sp.AAC.1
MVLGGQCRLPGLASRSLVPDASSGRSCSKLHLYMARPCDAQTTPAPCTLFSLDLAPTAATSAGPCQWRFSSAQSLSGLQ